MAPAYGVVDLFRFRTETKRIRDSADEPKTHAFVDTKLAQLFAYWDGLRRDRLLPRYTEIVPDAIQSLLPELSILDYLGPKTAIYRYTGTSVARRMQQDLLGQNVMALIPPETADTVAGILKQVAEWPAGATTRHVNTDPRGKQLLTYGLYLPLADKRDKVAQILALTLSQPLPEFTTPQAKVTIAGEFELLEFLDIGGGLPPSSDGETENPAERLDAF